MKINIIIIFFIIFISCKASDSIKIINVKNSNLFSILDTIDKYEQKCNYYNTKINKYNINIFLRSKDTIMLISPTIDIFKFEDIGMFNYNQRNYFIYGSLLDTTIFQYSDKTCLINFDTFDLYKKYIDGVGWEYLIKNNNIIFTKRYINKQCP